MTISPIHTTIPQVNCPNVHQAVLRLLDMLEIPYQYVTHEAADTMEDCRAISEALDVCVCKNLVLCNRQQTQFYLLCMPADKPFKTKDLSAQIGSSRLSFASSEHMKQFLGVAPGSASILSLMNDTDGRVQLLLDRPTYEAAYFGCHPCLNTGTVKVETSALLTRFLPHVGHKAIVVDLPDAADA